MFTSKSVAATNQSEHLPFSIWPLSKFKARVHVVKISATRNQNQLLNPVLELESFCHPCFKDYAKLIKRCLKNIKNFCTAIIYF